MLMVEATGVFEICERRNSSFHTHTNILIPGTCEYIALQSKRDFTDVVKAKDFEKGRLGWIIGVGPR